MKKTLLIILALATILLIGVAYANSKETTKTIKQEVIDVTIYSGYVITTSNSGQTVANYEEMEVKFIPPKKKVVKKSYGTGVSFLNRSYTHNSRKEEMEAQPVLSTREVQELIKKYARQYGVNENLALRIAGSESGYRYGAKNKISTAGGVYQQLLKYWDGRAKKYGRAGYSRFHAEANISVSIQMLKYEGTSHWNESKGAWGK